MIFKLSDIMRDVRVALDQNNSSEALLQEGDIDTLTLDEIIRSKVCESVRRVHIQAPVHMLEDGHNFGDTLYWEDNGSGIVLLPPDFMRLVLFRMSDWERPVYTAISALSTEYLKQSSRYKGIRGNVQKPVCAIVKRPIGLVLEFFSCNSINAQVSQALYLPEPKIDSNDGIDVCACCYKAVVYTAAALTSAACGAGDKYSIMSELAKTYLS